MVDLDDVLHHTLDQGDTALADLSLGDDATTVLRGRISARRARRRVLQTVVAAPIAAGLVLGGVLLAQSLATPVPEATQPTDPPSQVEPSPDDSAPDSTSAPTSVPQPLADEPGLPPRTALPDGLLEQTTPGWVLAVYTPGTADQPATQGVVVLAAPDGTTYEVTRLPFESARTDSTLELMDWQAGSTTAVVQRHDLGSDVEDAVTVHDVDLLTGALTPADVPVPGARLMAVTDDLRLWHDPAALELVIQRSGGRATYGPWGPGVADPSPDGRYVLADTTVVDTSSGRSVDEIQGLRADGYCLPLTWWTADQVLAMCTADDPSDWVGPYLDLAPRLVALTVGSDASGTEVHVLREGDPVLYAWYPTWVSDGAVVLQGTTLGAQTSTLGDLCPDGAYLVTASGTITALPSAVGSDQQRVFRSQVTPTGVLTQAQGGCVVDAPPGPLRSYDLATGATGVVLGPVAGDESWQPTRSSWLVGR